MFYYTFSLKSKLKRKIPEESPFHILKSQFPYLRTKASSKTKFERKKKELICYLGPLGDGRREENVYYQRCKNNDKVPN